MSRKKQPLKDVSIVRSSAAVSKRFTPMKASG